MLSVPLFRKIQPVFFVFGVFFPPEVRSALLGQNLAWVKGTMEATFTGGLGLGSAAIPGSWLGWCRDHRVGTAPAVMSSLFVGMEVSS